MANPEHLKVAKKGAKAIAAWREKHPEDRLDLRGARLFVVDLRGADLRGADLIGADLRGADLSGAFLSGANLSRVNLGGVDVSEAKFAYTILGDVDLSATKGLEAARHLGPSTIGVDTLLKSRGKIPEVFLRGCGVPKVWIEYLPSLTGKLFEFYSCFISHSSRDVKFAKRLHERMQGEGLRVWYAPEDMKGGRKTIEQIDQAIRVYDKFLLVLSEESMKSNWVRTEIKLARKREKVQGRQILFPIRLVSFKAIKDWECFDSDTGRDLAADVREYHVPDFSNWKDHDSFERAFADLLRDLRKDEKMA